MSGDRERFARVEGILDEALDLPQGEREEHIRTASGGDAALAAEVLDLLQACEDATDLLSTPPPLVARDILDNPPPPEDEFKSGDQVGNYRVLRLLGRGGMGAVYLAERADGFFEMQVALKVIKGAGASEEALARFEAERQILARLDHPNIVGILDGGTTVDGKPYVVMHLALGDPVDLFCDRMRLPVPKRLALFRSICDAVQYAHRNLVVHRDLKPSNVLVTPEGEVRLLDFGIATVLEAGPSSPGAPIDVSPRLTPEYASPEQVRGEPTTVATDVYALGMVLYELLTGERPYEVENKDMAGITEVVCRQVPREPSRRVEVADGAGTTSRAAELRGSAPSSLSQLLSGDLDAIVLKALEKEPDQRYGSATELSEDIRRHLEGRPVRARPATRWYRTSKFLRRYRNQVAAVMAAIVLLTGAAVTSTVQWMTAGRERDLRQQEAERAGLAESMLLSTFAELGEGHRGAVPIPPAEFVRVARGNLGRLTASSRLSAGLRSKLGTISMNLSEFGAADTLFAEALATVRDVEGAELERAEAMTGLGYRSLRGSLRGDSALVWFTSALAERRSVLPPGDTAITNSMIDRGFALYVIDSTSQALSLLGEALEREGPPLQRARGLEFLTNALMAYVKLHLRPTGQVQAVTDTLAAAERTALEALDILRRNGASKRIQYGNVLLSLAEVRAEEGKGRQAEEDAVGALMNYEAIVGGESQRTGAAWGWIGEARRVQGNLDGAKEAFEKALEIYAAVAPYWRTRAWLGLGQVHHEMGEFDEAEGLLLQILDPASTASIEERILALGRIESLYVDWGRGADAELARRRQELLLSSPAAP